VPPWLLLLLLLSLAIALAYQLVRRSSGRRVIAYWLVVFVALLAFEAGTESLGISLTRFGDLRLLPDMAGGALAVGIMWFLRV